MRLKFLFFPIMLIISISLTVGYIVPSVREIIKNNEENKKISNSLDILKREKDNIKGFDGQLNQDLEYKKIVYSYLPEEKSEERIINSLNYLATSSNVSIATIDLDKGLSGIPNVENNGMIVETANNVLSGEDIGSANNQIVDLTNVTVSVIGEYEKIELFLDQIYRMEMFNSINTLKITSQKNENGEGSENLLVADLEIGFGNMSKENQGKMIDSKAISASLDNVDELKKFILVNVPAQEMEAGAVGKSNPFLP